VTVSQPFPGADPGAFGRQVRAAAPAAKGVQPIAEQGSAKATTHLVKGSSKGVDDGAHGTHDYDDVDMHPAILGRFKAHGARLDNHDDRIRRLEGSIKAELGAPEH
jgi:hypothetical protein